MRRRFQIPSPTVRMGASFRCLAVCGAIAVLTSVTRSQELSQQSPSNPVGLPSQSVLHELVESAGGGIAWIRDPYKRYDMARRSTKSQAPATVGNRNIFLDHALERAKAEARLVMVYVPRIEGRPMYRAPLLDDYMRLSIWSDPTTVALVNRLFVPLRLYADASVAARLGIGNSSADSATYLNALEPAVFFVNPAGEVVHRVERIRTFSAPWFRALARRVLQANPQYARPSLQRKFADSKPPQERAPSVRAGSASGGESIERLFRVTEQDLLDGDYASARQRVSLNASKESKVWPILPVLIEDYRIAVKSALSKLEAKKPAGGSEGYPLWASRHRAQKSQEVRGARWAFDALLLSARLERLDRNPAKGVELLQAVTGELAQYAFSRTEYALELARCRLALGEWAAVESSLTSAGQAPEASWLRGVSLWQRRRIAEADREFAAVLSMATSPWAERAAAMFAMSDDTTRRSPLAHGFEMFRHPPARTVVGRLPTTTEQRRSGAPKELSQRIAGDALEFLLAQQLPDGSWADARYAYWPSPKIVPNVRVAVTALAATALLSWRAIAPKRVDAALARAKKYLGDDKRLSLGTEEEVYSQSYRMLFWTRCIAAEWGTVDDPVANLDAIIKRASAIQDKKSGFFAHEYKNAFCTGSIMWSLYLAKQAGVSVGDDMIQLGVSALRAARRTDGSFAYGGTAKERDAKRPPAESITRLKDSSARMPVCEAVLHAFGSSDQKRVTHAFETFLKYLDRLARVRKADFHSDGELGGFFFWHAVFHASEASGLCERDLGARVRKRLLELTASIQEIDGSFVDSHEIGKSYGTAMALLTLHNVAR